VQEIASPNPHLMNITSITRDLASSFWRTGWGCNQKKCSSYFQKQQTVRPFLLMLPNGYYFLYRLLTSFDMGDKTAQVLGWNPSPSFLLYLQMLCRVLEHTGLVIHVPEGTQEEKIQTELKKQAQTYLNFPFYSITYLLSRHYSSPMTLNCSWEP